MRFHEESLRGLFVIDLDPVADARGFFARTWCDREAAVHGLRTPLVQDSIAFNHRRGTLRGMHFHAAALPQVRVVRCVAGAAFVAAADLRSNSPTHLHVFEMDLESTTGRALYVPPGIALGYQTLEDATVIGYKMAEFYDPLHERGLRWNDPLLTIHWPIPNPIVNDRDASFPDYP